METVLQFVGVLAVVVLTFLTIAFVRAKRRHADYISMVEFCTPYVPYDFDSFIHLERRLGVFNRSIAWLIDAHVPSRK